MRLAQENLKTVISGNWPIRIQTVPSPEPVEVSFSVTVTTQHIDQRIKGVPVVGSFVVQSLDEWRKHVPKDSIVLLVSLAEVTYGEKITFHFAPMRHPDSKSSALSFVEKLQVTLSDEEFQELNGRQSIINLGEVFVFMMSFSVMPAPGEAIHVDP